jgi:hypothetical protein
VWLGAAIGLLPWLAAAAFACVHLALPLLGSLTVVMHVERHSGPCNGENMRPHPSHDVNPRSQPRHAETLWVRLQVGGRQPCRVTAAPRLGSGANGSRFLAAKRPKQRGERGRPDGVALQVLTAVHVGGHGEETAHCSDHQLQRLCRQNITPISHAKGEKSLTTTLAEIVACLNSHRDNAAQPAGTALVGPRARPTLSHSATS